LAFGAFVAVDAQLGGVGEVGAELDEERAEILIEAIEVGFFREVRGSWWCGVEL
jgi:hypothetical protein